MPVGKGWPMWRWLRWSLVLWGGLCLFPGVTFAQRILPTIPREQRSAEIRDPEMLPRHRLRDPLTPETVSKPNAELTPRSVTLDEALQTALQNTDVVRVLSGTSATTSGRTIYDASINNTVIDEQNSVFDPVLSVNNSWNRLENPTAIFDPMFPTQSLITGTRTDFFSTTTQIQKENALGGILGFSVASSPTRIQPGTFPLNPSTRSSATLNYTQPLLQGGRIAANLAPIIVARINTERSFFQFKDAMQEQVRGVIEAYWSLVASRVDVWARRRQVEQLEEAVRLIQARVRANIANRADLAQSELSLASFRANLVAAEASLIQREGALRNILGLGVVDGTRIVPVTPPIRDRMEFQWEQILDIASDRRPDVIELKLILEADQQLWVQARNTALPRLDAVSLYRWNGLDGEMPNGNPLTSPTGAYTDWTTGVNFSVPLGLRKSRAALRRQELIILRDRINLQQGLHNAEHVLATNVRTLDQLYDQYLAFRDARQAARVNLDAQLLRYKTQQTILLNVLQAISDWGNAITSEATSLAQYNTQLATLERQTGTILETHGIVFVEERFGAIGPLGRTFRGRAYSQQFLPTSNVERYTNGTSPAEESFELSAPRNLRQIQSDVPYDEIRLPTPQEVIPQSE